MFRRVRFAALLLLAATGSLPSASAVDSDAFETELRRAEDLNITAPWRESQVVLDALRPHLSAADNAQYARFRLIEARNFALAGELVRALELLDALLARDMPAELRLQAHSRAANVAYLSRRFRDAFWHLDAALQLLEDESLHVQGGDVYSFAAYTYTLVDEFDSAREFGGRAMESAREHGTMRDLCGSAQTLGFVYKESGQHRRSRDHYEQALAACETTGDQVITAVTRYGLADLLRRLGHDSDAQRLFEQAISDLEQADYRSGMAEARLYYARLEEARGAIDRVEALVLGTLDQFRQDRNWEYLAEAHRMLADAALGAGDEQAALASFGRYMDARERHHRQVRDRQSAFLEVRFEMHYTEQQLQLLQEQQRVQRLQAASRSRQRWLQIGVFVLIGLLVAILVVLLVRATRERRRFQSLSRRDALTALSNHTRFFELAERMLALTREKGIGFTLVIADIDHFKRVNDRHGHVAGDEVLRLAAGRLLEHFSDSGIVGRIGGEEFGIALPGLAGDEIERRLRAFRASLAATRRHDDVIDVTMSFGVARPRDHESLVEIRERADRALYRAKREGRDRVVDADRIDG